LRLEERLCDLVGGSSAAIYLDFSTDIPDNVNSIVVGGPLEKPLKIHEEFYGIMSTLSVPVRKSMEIGLGNPTFTLSYVLLNEIRLMELVEKINVKFQSYHPVFPVLPWNFLTRIQLATDEFSGEISQSSFFSVL
jgi:hypothetical protein